VKNIKFAKGDVLQVELDTNITPELKEEGSYREIVRAIQDMRKKAGLNPNDIISLNIKSEEDTQKLINKWKSELMKTVGVKDIIFGEVDSSDTKISDTLFTITIEK
jgi:isoleucyl-tRNA synthetase